MTRRNDSSSSFRPVVAGSHYVYSAYYDDRETTTTDAGRGVVRVIAVLRAAESAAALTPRAPAPALFCHVDMLSSGDWSLASVLMALVWTSRYYSAPLHYYEMCENHGKDYGGWILTCPLPRAVHRPPCRLLVPGHRGHPLRRDHPLRPGTTHCAVRPPCRVLVSASETVDPSTAVSLPVFSTKPTARPHSAPIKFVYTRHGLMR